MKNSILILFAILSLHCSSDIYYQYKMFAAEEYLKRGKCSSAISMLEEVSNSNSSYKNITRERVNRLKKGLTIFNNLNKGIWYYKGRDGNFDIGLTYCDVCVLKDGVWYRVTSRKYKAGDDPETNGIQMLILFVFSDSIRLTHSSERFDTQVR